MCRFQRHGHNIKSAWAGDGPHAQKLHALQLFPVFVVRFMRMKFCVYAYPFGPYPPCGEINQEKENSTIMKKLVSLLLTGALAAGLLSGCSNTQGGADATPNPSGSLAGTTITVGATPAPHAEILEVVKEVLAEQGITLDIKQYNDYVQPNNAVEDGSLDANYFQHITYMNDFNAENGTHLVSAAEVHYEPMGLYAGRTASLDALADGAQIGVPNDATNEARALLVLQQEGLITLREGAGITATVNDIEENPKNLEVVEMEAAQLPLRLADLDMAVINGNYAIDAGLNMSDALAVESAEGEAAQAYVNVLAVKEGRESDPAILALAEALCSPEVKSYIEEHYNGAVVAVF